MECVTSLQLVGARITRKTGNRLSRRAITMGRSLAPDAMTLNLCAGEPDDPAGGQVLAKLELPCAWVDDEFLDYLSALLERHGYHRPAPSRRSRPRGEGQS
jgi:hypothetical protein